MSKQWGNCQICSGTRFIDLNRPCGNCDANGNAPRIVVADVEKDSAIPVQVEKPVGRRKRLHMRALEIEYEKANRPL